MSLWRVGVGVLAATIAASSGCGEGQRPGPLHPPTEGPAASSTTQAVRAPPSFPARLGRLADAIPADAAVALGIPGYQALAAATRVRGTELDAVLSEGAKEVAPRLGLAPKDLVELLHGVREAGVFGQMQSDGEPELAAVLLVEDAARVDELLARFGLRETEPRHFQAKEHYRSIHVGWVRELGLLVVSTRQDLVDASFDTVLGQRKALAGSVGASRGAASFFATADLDALEQNEILSEGSTAQLVLPLEGAGTLDLRALGARIPRIGDVVAPAKHALVERLPKGAATAFALSLTRAKGKTLRDIVAELGRVEEGKGAELAAMADAILRLKTKLSLDDVDKALGDELCFGVYFSDKLGKQGKQTKGGPFAGITVLGALDIRDARTANALLKQAAEELKGKTPGMTSSPGKLSAPLASGAVLKIEVRKDVVLFATGDKVDVDKKLAAFGKGPGLGSDATFASRRKAARPESHAFVFVDYGAMKSQDPALSEVLTQIRDVSALVDVAAKPNPKGLDVGIQVDDAAALLGSGAGLALAGFRRYLLMAKTAEARSTVATIARGAVAAYERELLEAGGRNVTHKLCGSAPSVPAEVPKASKYKPLAEPGKDFQTGSQTEGWRCLRFEMTSPIYYRYEYRAGKGYKGPARGGPDPGPKGFEISAEGDLDGDGKTSLFTMTGKPGPRGTIELSRELFVADEAE